MSLYTVGRAALGAAVLVTTIHAGAASLLLDLPLDEGQGGLAHDRATTEGALAIHGAQEDGRFGQPRGPVWKSEACVAASCLRFDGYSTWLSRSALPQQALADGFTVSAWIAPYAFEWGDSPEDSRLGAILSQFDQGGKRGLVFGLSRFGTWGVSLGTGAAIYQIKATQEKSRVHRNEWSQIAFSYDRATHRFALVRDGEVVSTGELPAGTEVLLPATTLSIGRHSQPFNVVGLFKFNSYNGLANHLRLYAGALSPEEIRAQYQHDLQQRGGNAPIVSFDAIDIGPDYLATDRYRPAFHAEPNFGWMNEPHAPFYYKGQYHLFFQKNPFGPFWHQIHWGHWVSEDMVHWREIDIALAPTDAGLVTRDVRPTSPGYIGSVAPDGIWSGSATYDGHGNPVLFITAGNDSKTPSQAVGMAIPTNLGDPLLREWSLFPKTVIEQAFGDGKRGDFRDPFVFFDKSVKKYFALVSSGDSRSGTALVYESRNLVDWTSRGALFDIDGGKYPQAGSIWELPVFLPVGKDATGKEKWALLINAHGPGSVLDVYYWLGSWDPVAARFISDQEAPRKFDMGQGHFTGPSGFIDPKTGRPIVFSIAQGERAPQLEYDSGWAHTAGMPVQLRLTADGQLGVQPIDEVDRLHDQTLLDLHGVTLAEANAALKQVHGDLLDIEVEYASTTAAGVRVRAHPEGVEATDLGFDPKKSEFYADRSKSTIDPDQRGVDRNAGSVQVGAGPLKFRILVDRSLVEAYLNDEYSLTTRIYPSLRDSDGVALLGDPQLAVQRVVVHSMKTRTGAPVASIPQGQWNIDPRILNRSDLPNHAFERCDLSGWTVKSGDAFSDATVTRLTVAPGHNVYFNQAQRSDSPCILWGYAVGDDAVGEMESAHFTLGAGEINFLIGGGNDLDHLYIALVRESDGHELFRATGTDSEQMNRVLWDAKAYIGQRVFFRVVDQARGGWGHVNLGAINVTFSK